MRAADVVNQVTNSAATAAKKKVTGTVTNALQEAILGKDKSISEIINEGSGNSLNRAIAGVNEQHKIYLSAKPKNYVKRIIDVFNDSFGDFLDDPELHALNFFKLEIAPRMWITKKIFGYKINSICTAKPLGSNNEAIYNETDQKMTSLFRDIQKKDKKLIQKNRVSNPVTLVALLVPRINEVIAQMEDKIKSELFDRLSAFIHKSAQVVDEWYWAVYTFRDDDIEQQVVRFHDLAQEFGNLAQVNTSIPNLIEPTTELTERLSTMTASVESLLRDFLPDASDAATIDFNLRSKSIEWLLAYNGKVMNMLNYTVWKPNLSIDTVNEVDFRKVIQLHNDVNELVKLFEEFVATHRVDKISPQSIERIGDKRIKLLKVIEERLGFQNKLIQSMGVNGVFHPFYNAGIIGRIKRSTVYGYKNKDDQILYEHEIEGVDIPDATYYLLNTALFYRELSFSTLSVKTMKYFVKECHYGGFTSEVRDLNNYLHKSLELIRTYAQEIQRFAAKPTMDLLDGKVKDPIERRTEKFKSHAIEIIDMLNGVPAEFIMAEDGVKTITQKGIRGAMHCLHDITHQLSNCDIIADGEAMSRGQKFLRMTLDFLGSHCHDAVLSKIENSHGVSIENPEIQEYLKVHSRLPFRYGSAAINAMKLETMVSVKNLMNKSPLKATRGINRSDTASMADELLRHTQVVCDSLVQEPSLSSEDVIIPLAKVEGLDTFADKLEKSFVDYKAFSNKERHWMRFLTQRHTDTKIEQARRLTSDIMGLISASVECIELDPNKSALYLMVAFNRIYQHIEGDTHGNGWFNESHSISHFLTENLINASAEHAVENRFKDFVVENERIKHKGNKIPSVVQHHDPSSDFQGTQVSSNAASHAGSNQHNGNTALSRAEEDSSDRSFVDHGYPSTVQMNVDSVQRREGDLDEKTDEEDDDSTAIVRPRQQTQLVVTEQSQPPLKRLTRSSPNLRMQTIREGHGVKSKNRGHSELSLRESVGNEITLFGRARTPYSSFHEGYNNTEEKTNYALTRSIKRESLGGLFGRSTSKAVLRKKKKVSRRQGRRPDEMRRPLSMSSRLR